MQERRTDIYTAHRRSDGSAVPFPVTWEDADDAALVWRWASDHYPLPTTPLAVDLNKDAIGMTRSYAYFGGLTRIKYLQHQGYGFGPHTFLPSTGESPEFEKNVAAAGPKIRELWFDTWWPLIEREARALREEDFSGLDLPGRVRRLQEAADRYTYHYELMMRASRMVRPPRADLLAFVASRFSGEEPETLVTALQSGVPNVSLEASGALWEVAQQLKGRPELIGALGTEQLASLPGGAAFLASFHAWLDRYGQRNSSFEEVADPSWMEDPTVPLSIVRGHAIGNTADPRVENQQAMARREELQRSLEARLGSDDDIAEFRRLVDLALPYSAVRESRPFASNISRAAQRRPALAVGRALVTAGLVEQAEDVFFLHLDELELAATAGGRSRPWREIVAARRADLEFYRGVVPPLAIGAIEGVDLAGGLIGEGIGVSAGAAQGRARVILDLKDADSFQPGEVLVTISTSPLWTALFGLASAVVTDSGGMLSHSSIAAREHQIPAVVGVRGATERIRTGDRLLVNGTAGTIDVLGGD